MSGHLPSRVLLGSGPKILENAKMRNQRNSSSISLLLLLHLLLTSPLPTISFAGIVSKMVIP